MNPMNNDNPTRLSAEERQSLKREFSAYLTAHPAQEPPVTSPYLTFLRSPIFASLAVFFVLGGTVYAAEGSLPNDPLYALKTEVIEPIVVSVIPLAGASEGGAHTRLVERRLEEAEKLMARGELTDQSAAVLTEKISRSASKVRAFASTTAGNGDVGEALEASSELETALEGHEEILEAIADEQGTSTRATSTDALIDAIDEEGQEVRGESEVLEDKLVAVVATSTQEYASELAEEVAGEVTNLKEALARDGEAPLLLEEVQRFLALAERYQQSGLDFLTKENLDGAISDLRDARSAAKKGLALLESSEELEDALAEEPAPEE